ncbi:MAG: Ig-like domain-containing protein [Gemmatimonadota bacterium]
MRFSRLSPFGAFALAFAAVNLSCNSPAQPGPGGPAAFATGPFIVSSPSTVQAAQPSGSKHATASLGASTIYVSLPPDSIPTGVAASIRDFRTGASITVPVVGGGFDPTPLVAAVGDTIAVTIQAASGAGKSYTFLVPAHAPPIVVRTSPPPNKRDVSLNALIVVVFSEPMDGASLPAAITLVTGGAAVSGSVTMPSSVPIIQATFVPATALIGVTSYQLQVSTAAKNLKGIPIGSPVQIDFTTGTLPPDTTAPLLNIISPLDGDTEPVAFPNFRAVIQDDRGATEVSWDLVDSAAGNTISNTIVTSAPTGFMPDGMYNLWRPLHPGTFTVDLTAYDDAGHSASAAPMRVVFVDPDSQPRIVVRNFTMVEYEAYPGSGYIYAPQLVVADATGQTGVDIVGFEILNIPGMPQMQGNGDKAWARSLVVPPAQDIQLFEPLYGDYPFAVSNPSLPRSTGGLATARLTYRDLPGHIYATTIQGLIVPGGLPTSYTSGCGHWYPAGLSVGDLSYCGWSASPFRLRM